MITCIASYKNAKAIEMAIKASNKPILDMKTISDFDFYSFIKEQIDQIHHSDIFIIDLSALKNADNEIIEALKNYRILYDEVRIIILAHYKERGDKLLSDIFDLGIYDIIAGIDDEDMIYEELIYCIQNKKSFRESLKYKDTYTVVEAEPVPVKERVIIKNEIRPAVNKAFIGFMGTQSRIGVTHNAILCSNYLKNKGFKVAIIEEQSVTSKTFNDIRESFDIEAEGEYFNLNQIDYYPNFDIKDIFRILSKNYNFIIIDFGKFKLENIAEFNRCVLPVIVAGSKPWEIDNINEIFASVGEKDLKEYYYLFNFTANEDKKKIKKGMGELKNVFFADYTPDPFNSYGYEELDNMFKGYIPETITHTKSQGINIKELIKYFSKKKETSV